MALAKSMLSSLAFASNPPKQRLVDHLHPIFVNAGSDSVAEIGVALKLRFLLTRKVIIFVRVAYG
jgi:hypothetical protein